MRIKVSFGVQQATGELLHGYLSTYMYPSLTTAYET